MTRWALIAIAAVALALAGFGLAACGGKGGSDAKRPGHTLFTLPEGAISVTETSPRVATVKP
ncbi:MAG: hypothetical protein M3R70_10635 [Actinomycetota bacterium]|nr:hypothetical protein [Actinomycetota bacterium]